MSLNFPLLLVLAVAICGALALYDRIILTPRRQKAVALYRSKVTTADEAALKELNKEPFLIEHGKSLFPVLAIVLILRSFLVEPFQIPSGSMIPTLDVGDFILVNKFTYGLRLPVLDTKIVPISDPQRGDVMVFRYPSDPNINYIKRVIGIPGDHIRYSSNKQLYINDQLVKETLIGEEPHSLGSAQLYLEQLATAEHVIRKEMNNYRMLPGNEWVVPAGHYFMMGDNRDNSNDSRYWNDPNIPKELQGMVPDSNIVGKAFAIWMSWPDPKLQNMPTFSRARVIE